VDTDLGMLVGGKHIKDSTEIEERLAMIGKAHDDGNRGFEDGVIGLN
jgi:hypothetical protein